MEHFVNYIMYNFVFQKSDLHIHQKEKSDSHQGTEVKLKSVLWHRGYTIKRIYLLYVFVFLKKLCHTPNFGNV